jgi:succinate dehydrogenase / fumarate reductase cytochrome b subunit
MRYRSQLGFWAFLLMRISAVAITLYLVLHITVLSYLLKGPTTFDKLMKTVQSPLFKFFELALLGGVLFHAFNGLRIVWIDFASAAQYQKALFWAMMSLAAGVFIFGAIPILKTFYR